MRDLLRDDDRAPLGEVLSAMQREGRRRAVLMGLLFAMVALTAIAIGWNWPKKYFASTTILVAEDKTIQKLMEGRAVPTSVTDRAIIAREVMFSRKVMDDILEKNGWLADDPTPAERGRLVEAIQARTVIGAPRENLIRVEYWDNNAQRAQHVAQQFADHFMLESRDAQLRESREAYDFIADQAARYHEKLQQAEAHLIAYRKENPDARAEPVTVVESRLAGLRQRLARDEASLDEAARQSAGAAPAAAVDDPYAARIAAAQEELAENRLRYTDAHPEVVRLQRQLDALRGRRAAAPPAVASRPAVARDSSEIRARIAATEREIAAETERLRRQAAPPPEFAELLREHEVARDLYQDLLRRLEYARVSMALDEEGRGLNMRIHESAALPMRPAGVRFAHFALGGLAAAAAMPLGLLFLFVRFDPHLRSAGAVQRRTGLPVLADVPTFWTPADRRLLRRDVRIAGVAVVCTVAVVAAASFVKLMQSS